MIVPDRPIPNGTVPLGGLGSSWGSWGGGLGEVGVETLIFPTSGWKVFVSLLAAASTGLSAYHGYKRNDSVGWAVAWGLLGGLFPVITPAVAFAQGFGERK